MQPFADRKQHQGQSAPVSQVSQRQCVGLWMSSSPFVSKATDDVHSGSNEGFMLLRRIQDDVVQLSHVAFYGVQGGALLGSCNPCSMQF